MPRPRDEEGLQAGRGTSSGVGADSLAVNHAGAATADREDGGGTLAVVSDDRGGAGRQCDAIHRPRVRRVRDRALSTAAVARLDERAASAAGLIGANEVTRDPLELARVGADHRRADSAIGGPHLAGRVAGLRRRAHVGVAARRAAARTVDARQIAALQVPLAGLALGLERLALVSRLRVRRTGRLAGQRVLAGIAAHAHRRVRGAVEDTVHARPAVAGRRPIRSTGERAGTGRLLVALALLVAAR